MTEASYRIGPQEHFREQMRNINPIYYIDFEAHKSCDFNQQNAITCLSIKLSAFQSMRDRRCSYKVCFSKLTFLWSENQFASDLMCYGLTDNFRETAVDKRLHNLSFINYSTLLFSTENPVKIINFLLSRVELTYNVRHVWIILLNTVCHRLYVEEGSKVPISRVWITYFHFFGRY